MHCAICGTAVDPPDRYCKNCGTRLTAEAGQAAPVEGAFLKRDRRRRFQRTLRNLAGGIVILSLAVLVLAQMAPDILQYAVGKPKDLGVKYTQSDLDSLLAKTGVKSGAPPEGTDRRKYRVEYVGEKKADWTITEAEICAWLNLDKKAGYWPFADAQIKLHEDNIVEIALLVDPVKLLTYDCVMSALPQQYVGVLSEFPVKLPIYVKAKITFPELRRADVHVLDCKVPGISLSMDAIGAEADMLMNAAFNGVLGEIRQASVTGLTIGEGTLRLTGTWYEELRREPK